MKELYLNECYVREFDSVVSQINKKFVVLENTAFYPNSGGQPNDTGKISTNTGEVYNVVYVGKFNGNISHEVDKSGLKEGDKVKCSIDWNRRYKLMRYHTAAHIVSEIINIETGAKITGNQLSLEKGRIDFNLENYDPNLMKVIIDKSNDIISKEYPVKKYFMDREEALKIPELFQLKDVLPPGVKELRIVEIVGFAKNACGGTHVDNIKEIGKISFLKSENKGKNNRRLYFTIE